MITGAQAMVQCLLEEKVPVVFGYPGVAIAPFYDALAGEGGIRHILTRTEQGAGHAASGYARVTGRPGVCVATSGPGATNLFTALATAFGDSIPLVAVTGQVNTWQLGRDVFQEVDTTGAVEPFTKYAYLVKSAEELPRVFKEAFHIASTGRMGPVLIDVPLDVQRQMISFSYPPKVSIRGYKPRTDGHPLQVRRVAEALAGASQPVICCGGGAFLSGAREQVIRFCERTQIPLVTTLMGLGVLPHDHPLNMGLVGRVGSVAANTAVDESDLLVLIGARVGDRAITRPDNLETTTVVHIDIDTAEIGKNVDTTIPLVGDAASVLNQLTGQTSAGTWSAWTERLAAIRREERAATPKASPHSVNPERLVRGICARLPEGAAYVADVGQNQVWSARAFSAPGRFLTTGGMGTMGYAIPAALGAKLARPEKVVVAVSGDGGFQISMNELATAVQHSIPIKLVVINNGVLGMVREMQLRDGTKPFAVDLSGSPDLEKIAAAYGIAYRKADTDEQAERALDLMFADDASCLLECVVDPEEASH